MKDSLLYSLSALALLVLTIAGRLACAGGEPPPFVSPTTTTNNAVVAPALPSPPAALDASPPSPMAHAASSGTASDAPPLGGHVAPHAAVQAARPTEATPRFHHLQSRGERPTGAAPSNPPAAPSAPSFFDGVRFGALALKRNPDVATLDELARIALAFWQQEQAARAAQQQGGSR